MNQRLLLFGLLLPVVLPLLLAGLALLVRSSRRWSHLLFAGFLLAALPLLPLPIFQKETPVLPWLSVGSTIVPIQLSIGSENGGAQSATALLLLIAGALGVWSISRFQIARYQPLDVPGTVEDGMPVRVSVAGILLTIAGGQLAVLSVAPLLTVFGVGVALIGTLLTDLAATPPGDDTALWGVTPLLLATFCLLVAAFDRHELAGTSVLWPLGCALILLVAPIRMATIRVSLDLHAPAQAIGLPVIALWLLLSKSAGTLSFHFEWSPFALAGLAAFLLGAINTVAGATLGEVLAAQWGAQLGLVLLAAGLVPASQASASMIVFVTLLNAVVSTLGLGLMLGRLVLLTKDERIADLPGLPMPLRRAGLAYALAAASAAGLPLTLGFTVRQQLSTMAGSPAVHVLLLAGSSLLLFGLLAPLAAFFRRLPVLMAGTGAVVDQRGGAGLLLGLLLVGGAPYREVAAAIGTLLLAGTAVLADALASLALALLQIGVGLVILAYANRSLKHNPALIGLNSGLPIEEDPGWALPFAAIRQIVAPFSLRLWFAAACRAGERLKRLAASPGAMIQRIERHYYLGLIVCAAIGIV